jgi:hypothetical protein
LGPCAAFAQSQDKTTGATPSNVRPNDLSKTPITQVKKAAPVAGAEPKSAAPVSPEVHKAQVTRTSVNFQEHFKNGWQMYLQNPNHTGFGSLMSFVPKGNLRWSFPAEGAVDTSAAIYRGTIAVSMLSMKKPAEWFGEENSATK